jgi:eukaryotic-like serine/threonine-protein kinase
MAHYEIVAKLGEGGMGVVYKARDHHLDRFVAIKVLPPHLLLDAERKQRFVQEAKAASALNHPNIITIYDIGSEDGEVFIAMEYVAGKTLDQLIPRHGMRLEQVLRISIPIADALAKAHEAGIVHRDLKPSNTIVDNDGRVRLLDFGLAKLTQTERPDDSDETLAQVETEEGAIVGTVSYMAPEQAEGRKADARSDIFSFGAVLYEMVTGQRAFQGSTRVSTLMAVMQQDPKPPSEIAPVTPRDLDKIIGRCLRKDPERRFQLMKDVRIALEELKEESDSGKLPAAPAAKNEVRGRGRSGWIAAGAVLLLMAGLAATWLWKLRATAAPADLTMRALTADSGLTTDPVVSQDGRLLAYASDRATQKDLDIWVHPLTAGGQPVRLTKDGTDESSPDFSPDGGLIAFHSSKEGGGIYLIPALGGEERLLVRHGKYPRFSPDGKWIAYCTGCDWLVESRIFMVPVSGGSPVQIAREAGWASVPVFSRDGRHILFNGAPAPNDMQSHDLWITPTAGGAAVKTGALSVLQKQGVVIPRNQPVDWTGDSVLFAAQDQIWNLRITPGDWKAAGPAQRLTSGTGVAGSPRFAGDRGVTFVSKHPARHLSKVKMNADKGRLLGDLEPLPQAGGSQMQPSASADGRLLAYHQVNPDGHSVRLRDMSSGKERVLAMVNGRPKVSPDGSRVAYGVFPNAIHLAPASGGESVELVRSEGNVSTQIYGWTSDGKSIVYWTGQPIRFFLLDPVTGKSRELISHPKFDIHSAEVSPDLHWVAFSTPMGRRTPLWIAAVRDGKAADEKDWIAVSEDLDVRPWWSPNGALLYTLCSRDGFPCIWATPLDAKTKRPAGPPFPVLHFHSARLDPVFGGLANFGPAILPDAIIFSLQETTGNVWIAEKKN